MLLAQSTFDKFYMWPDGYFVSAEETQEFEDALTWRSDDFETVYVYEYEGDWPPLKWLSEKEFNALVV